MRTRMKELGSLVLIVWNKEEIPKLQNLVLNFQGEAFEFLPNTIMLRPFFIALQQEIRIRK